MITGGAWIDELIAEASKRHPQVTSSSSSTIAGLLAGRLQEKRLAKGELAAIAGELLAAANSSTDDMEETP
jgi:hypothetical protein